ncbi:hypothetical protein HZB69_01920 [Candidatus Amesbacteria bacterium]|nr:hypothetical protein [Candidatus Amesbacteria bacterium]
MDTATVSTHDLNTLFLYREVVAMRKNLDDLCIRLTKVISQQQIKKTQWDLDIEAGLNDVKRGRVTKFSSINEYLQTMQTKYS